MMKRVLSSSNRENGGARSPLPAFSLRRKAAACLCLAVLLAAETVPGARFGFAVPARAEETVEEYGDPTAQAETVPMTFSDVPDDAWYRGDVAAACAAGLVNGRSAAVFAPLEPVLRCEAVKLAVCLRERAESGSVLTRNAEGIWYSSFVESAVAAGIVDPGFAGEIDWTQPATRGEIFGFFARALPHPPEEINEIPDSSIPDVPMSHPYAAGIYALYRAGAAQGTDATTRACSPDAPVTRAECAATLMRLYDPDSRIRFSMPSSAGEETGAETAEREWSALTLAWAEDYETRFGAGTSDEVLLTEPEIAAYNAAMTAACPTMEDLAAWPDWVEGSLVASKIAAYVFPAGYDYDADGSYVGEETRQAILANRALADIPAEAKAERAVVTSRCDLRSFPSATVFAPYGNPGFDRAQETELSVGMPVLVLHESADGEFLFVQACHYAGWIPSSSAALCGRDTFERFARRDPSSGVTVTAASVQVGGIRLDMGVWLPFLGESGGGLDVLVPVRGADGTYAEAAFTLSEQDAVRGVLPYTAKNFYEQAFRYLGVPYGWGGLNGGVDCSGFVCCVLRTFGIILPRNTSEQRVYGGRPTDLSGLGAEERLAVLQGGRFPSAIYRKGHVMLFLGLADGGIRIIHAHSIGSPVSLETVDPRSDMLAMVEFRY